MSAADEIQAAVEKMTQLRVDSSFDTTYSTDPYVIVTLHSTIDAQLAILRSEIERHRESLILPHPLPYPLRDGYDADSLEEWVRSLSDDERDRYRSGVKPLILTLARAINGATS